MTGGDRGVWDAGAWIFRLKRVEAAGGGSNRKGAGEGGATCEMLFSSGELLVFFSG